MDKPKLSWYTKMNTEEKYSSIDNLYAGTYTDDNIIKVDIQLWNNRYGKEDVKQLDNFYINIFFQDDEDSSLLENCTVSLGGTDSLSFVKTGNKATLQFTKPIVLKGTRNNGASKGNEDHYINLEFSFSAEDKVLKEDDLKTLFFEVIQK